MNHLDYNRRLKMNYMLNIMCAYMWLYVFALVAYAIEMLYVLLLFCGMAFSSELRTLDLCDWTMVYRKTPKRSVILSRYLRALW